MNFFVRDAIPPGFDYRLPPDLVVGQEYNSLSAAPVSWAMNYMKVDALRKISRGKGIKVGIIDTGIAADHEQFASKRIVATKIVTGESSVYDGNGHGCILGSDKIYTSLSGFDSIENVYEGLTGPIVPDNIATIKDVRAKNIFTYSADKKTGEAKSARINAVHKLTHKGKMFRVRTNHGTITLTPWHPVYVVTSTRGEEQTIKSFRADELKEGDSILASSCKDNLCEYQTVGGRQIDEDTAFWLGMVASDGHVMASQKAVSFSNTVQDTGEVFSGLCQKLFAKKPAVYQYSGAAAEWRLHCPAAWDFAVACGIPSGSKSRTIRLPEAIKKSPRSVVMAFVAGYAEGNGCLDTKMRLATGSYDFASELSDLLRMLGVRSQCHFVKPSRSKHFSYSIAISADEELVQAMRVKKTDNLAPPKRLASAAIQDIEVFDYDGDVYDLTVEGTTVYACNGHIVSNTHCAATVAGDDPNCGHSQECEIFIVKGLTNGGSGRSDGLGVGFEWLDAQGCHVISASLGGPSPDQWTEAALRKFAARGGYPIIAAGNERQQGRTVGYPAAYPFCLPIAAHDVNGKYASFSNPGKDNKQLAISSPGVNIVSAKPGGGYVNMSGTSMACPNAAGVAVLFLGSCLALGIPFPTPEEYRNILFNYALDAGTPGIDRDYGPGYLRCDLLARWLEQGPPPVAA